MHGVVVPRSLVEGQHAWSYMHSILSEGSSVKGQHMKSIGSFPVWKWSSLVQVTLGKMANFEERKENCRFSGMGYNKEKPYTKS